MMWVTRKSDLLGLISNSSRCDIAEVASFISKYKRVKDNMVELTPSTTSLIAAPSAHAHWYCGASGIVEQERLQLHVSELEWTY